VQRSNSAGNQIRIKARQGGGGGGGDRRLYFRLQVLSIALSVSEALGSLRVFSSLLSVLASPAFLQFF